MTNDDKPLTGEWVKVTGDSGYIYDMFIGESEDLPELEDMLRPPSKTRNALSG